MHAAATDPTNPEGRGAPSLRRRILGGVALVALFAIVVWALPRPASVKPEAWRLLGIFIATIGGLILEPVPGGAIVLLAVTAASIWGGLSIQQALAGYGDPTVWLVMAAFFISRALIKTGLARRIALFFVRLFGKTSLGVTYALSLSDMVLASIIPSNAARSGGVTLPVVRSIAEVYGSLPGPTSGLLGSYLILAVFQNSCISAAMFFTGQASNPLAAGFAADLFGVSITWVSWLAAGIVPGLCSLAVAPYLVYRLAPPELKNTPAVVEFAARELAAMGPARRGEKIATLVFLAVCGLWITSPLHGMDITVTALLGSAALLVTGVLSWEDVKSEKAAWDIFIWYGGLVRLGRALGESGITTEFARAVSSMLGGGGWVLLFVLALLVYFYAHYGFASITAHIVAMYPAFVTVLVAAGAPAGLTTFAFACYTNLAAGLTHYGTTPAPMYFAQGYVSLRKWWRVGFLVSLMNLAIWSTIGLAWWRFLGLGG